MTRLLSTLLLSLLLVVASASAEVVRIEVTSRSDVADGKTYGLAGPYERIAGTIYFAVDPNNPANRIITDIDYAPRNADGKVEFRSDFYLIKPKDISRGNGTLFYEVSNRGGKGMLGYYNNAGGSRAPLSEAEMGDGFLLEHGFTLLWVGWQFDVPLGDGRVRVYPPVATLNGTPITGLVRSEVIVSEVTYDRSLADRNHQPYEVVNPGDPAHVMTVRDTVDGARRVVPRDQWQFARRTDSGAIVADRTRVYLEGGFQPARSTTWCMSPRTRRSSGWDRPRCATPSRISSMRQRRSCRSRQAHSIGPSRGVSRRADGSCAPSSTTGSTPTKRNGRRSTA